MGSEADGGKKMMILAKAGGPRSGGDLGALKPVSRGQGRGESAHERIDVYELVTQRIMEKLEAGTVPWQTSSIARVGLPRNFSTGKAYSGINVFLLASLEFQSPYFMTYLQASEMGGHVRKGEKGFPIIKMGVWEKDRGDGQTNGEGDPETEKRKFLRCYTVFNSSQIEGIPFPEPEKCDTYSASEQAEAARLIVEGMPRPPALFEGRKATPHYLPGSDTVEMPSRETFRAEWRFYKTLFHELAHSTGHASRLNRRTLIENRGMFAPGAEGRKTYCEEELVAEMTAAFLGAHAGIIEDEFENSAAYLKGWMEVLQVKDHKTWLVRAASEAQKAAEYILGDTK
jgi:antirestriction protein ArdC